VGEALRVKKVLALQNYFGRVKWQGDLSEMREDKLRRTRPSSANRKNPGN
jgi:hypothetical protein